MRSKTASKDHPSVILQEYLENLILNNLRSKDLRELKEKILKSHESKALKQQLVNLLYREKKRIIEAYPTNPSLKKVFSNTQFINRIAEVAVERIKCSPDAPVLRIDNKVVNAEIKNLYEGINVGLIFGAETILFQEIVLAYQADESSSRCYGEPQVNILGVHVNWLTEDGEASRSLIVDKSWKVKEVEFKEPVHLHVVHILHLPSDEEREMHRKLSKFFKSLNIPQINPYKASERADDKYWTHKLWISKVETPSFMLITKGNSLERSLQNLLKFAEMIGRTKKQNKVMIFIQPNHGTEGRHVERFEINISNQSLDEKGKIAQHITKILAYDDVLVREERGNIRFRKDDDPEEPFRYISFRLNVAWNGIGFIAESGYAQISKSSRCPVASRGRGGEIISLHKALHNLYREIDAEWLKLRVSSGDFKKIKKSAEIAALKLNANLPINSYLKMVGIDLVLEEKDGSVYPVLLEANPRPAGLAHLTCLNAAFNGKLKLKISQAIFDTIRSLVTKKEILV